MFLERKSMFSHYVIVLSFNRESMNIGQIWSLFLVSVSTLQLMSYLF